MTVFRNVRLLDYFDNRCDRGTRLTKAERLPGMVPLITAGVENKGVAQYIDHNKQLFDKDSITIDMFGNTFYRNYEFYADDNILVLHKQVYSKNILLYFTGAISQATYGRFSYAKQFRQKILQNLIVSLPFTDSGQLDVQYMEQYIRRVEAEYIKRLEADYTKRVEAYLATLGYESLDDCELSSQDLKVLSGPNEWGEFVLSGLFDYIEQGSRLKKSDQLPGDLPYVMSGITNQGIANYISNNLNLMPAGSLTVDILGNVFYRSYKYGLSDDVGCYYDKKYSYKQMLYLATAISKAMTGKYSYGKKFRSSQSSWIKIKLPVTPDGKPDYDFMDQYITAIEKKKVLKLKQAMDHKLDLYREVSHQN